MKLSAEENFYKNYCDTLHSGLSKIQYFENEVEINEVDFYEKLILKTSKIKDSGQLFFFGNGASSSISNHMALDWSKNGGVKAMSLSDSAFLTAVSNDYKYEKALVEYFKIYGNNKNDMIITTSSSGNSKNITRLLEYASEKNIETLSFSGLNPNNKSIKFSNLSLYVPFKTYGMVECAHQIIHHLWLDYFMGIKEWDRDSIQNMDYKEFRL